MSLQVQNWDINNKKKLLEMVNGHVEKTFANYLFSLGKFLDFRKYCVKDLTNITKCSTFGAVVQDCIDFHPHCKSKKTLQAQVFKNSR